MAAALVYGALLIRVLTRFLYKAFWMVFGFIIFLSRFRYKAFWMVFSFIIFLSRFLYKAFWMVFRFIIHLTRFLYKAFLYKALLLVFGFIRFLIRFLFKAFFMVFRFMVFGFIKVLTRFLYKAFLMDRIHTEASQSVGEEFKRSIIEEGQEIQKRLDSLFGRTSFLGLKHGVSPRSLQRLRAPLVVNESDVVGRDGDEEEITVVIR